MLYNDIMLQQQLEKARKLDLAWAAFQEEAIRLDREAHAGRGPVARLRGLVAAGLVRISIWLDSRAGERAFARTSRTAERGQL